MKSTSIFEKILHNPIVQTLVVYVSGGWIVLEITEYLISNFHLSPKARIILLILLLCLLPIVVFLAWYIPRKQSKQEEPGTGGSETKVSEPAAPAKHVATKQRKGIQGVWQWIRITRIWIPVLLIIVAVSVSYIFRLKKQARIEWAREVVLPRLAAIAGNSVEGNESWEGLDLAGEVRDILPEEFRESGLWSDLNWKVRFYTEPSGAEVFLQPYSDTTGSWRFMGTTPIDSVFIPKGLFRVRFEKEGYRTLEDLVWNHFFFLGDSLFYPLAREGTIPDEMVMIPYNAVKYNLWLPGQKVSTTGLQHLTRPPMQDFLMDRFEVTNKEYKRFVEEGGYENPDYWDFSFEKDGKPIGWREAMSMFKDQTGRPGPSTWQVGDYPEGEGDYPVRGISWYEASAYASYAGKDLPSVYQWDFAALNWASSKIVPVSNLTNRGPLPVGASGSYNRFGTCDLAGNVREWCYNETTTGNQRFIMGGAWNDPVYAFNISYALDPFDRSGTNGFRCIRYISPEEKDPVLLEPIELPHRDFMHEPRATNEVFKVYLNQFRYDPAELDANVQVIRKNENYTEERITFKAAYGNEQMIAYLFLPDNGTPPYQTVIRFPGAGAIFTRTEPGLGGTLFLLKSGRAVLIPVFKGTYERGDELNAWLPDETNAYKEHVIKWGKDLSRSIDYLETRSDIDTGRIAYMGTSWGSSLGAIMPAVEKRIKTSVLVIGGLPPTRCLPEVDPINYLPHIRIPVLMLDGRYDFIFPHETSQLPFYELLGTSPDQKKIILYDQGHAVPNTERIKETLNWLDRYLGPVN